MIALQSTTFTFLLVRGSSPTQKQKNWVGSLRRTYWAVFRPCAVLVPSGGGVNHRLGLYDAVLVKGNHIAEWPHPKWGRRCRSRPSLSPRTPRLELKDRAGFIDAPVKGSTSSSGRAASARDDAEQEAEA
jgi:hypothetical protein